MYVFTNTIGVSNRFCHLPAFRLNNAREEAEESQLRWKLRYGLWVRTAKICEMVGIQCHLNLSNAHARSEVDLNLYGVRLLACVFIVMW